MKVKLYIVTYNNEKDLNSNLESIFNSNLNNHELEVTVINNHSNFSVSEKFLKEIKVIHNSIRPDFSTGHLSRNWNQAIINGFKSLNNPDCDILAHCQVDTIFNQNWISDLVQLHENFTFIQQGIGDNFCSYLSDSVKYIGIWDEKFCGIGYQEADYFLRAFLHNREFSSINDFHHKRVWQPLKKELCKRTEPIYINDKLNVLESHIASSNYHTLNKNFFIKKWGVMPEDWANNLFRANIVNSLIENYIYYPYFELDVLNLEDKKYFVNRNGIAFSK